MWWIIIDSLFSLIHPFRREHLFSWIFMDFPGNLLKIHHFIQQSTPAVRCLRPLQLPGKISSLILLLLQKELKSVAQLVAMMNRSLFQFLFNRQYFIGIFSGFFLAAALIYVPVLNCNQDDGSINFKQISK